MNRTTIGLALILLWFLSLVGVGYYQHASGYAAGVQAERQQWEQLLRQQKDRAAAAERKYAQDVQEAERNAINRETNLRRERDAAMRAADGLRVAIGDYKRRLSNVAGTSGNQPAATVADLLGQCADEYRGLAETADRHASDIRKLIEAWPGGNEDGQRDLSVGMARTDAPEPGPADL